MLLTVYRNKSRCILNTGAHFGCLGSLVVFAFDPVTRHDFSKCRIITRDLRVSRPFRTWAVHTRHPLEETN